MASRIKGRNRLTSRTVPPVTLALFFLTTISVTQARDLCADIDYLIDQSRSQFTEIVDKPNDDAGDYDVTLTLTGASYRFVTKKSKRNCWAT